jgi:hypothetical protein
VPAGEYAVQAQLHTATGDAHMNPYVAVQVLP